MRELKLPIYRSDSIFLILYICVKTVSSGPLQTRSQTGEILRHTEMFPIKSSAYDWDVSLQVNFQTFKKENTLIKSFK